MAGLVNQAMPDFVYVPGAVGGCALVQPVARGPDLSGAISLPSPRQRDF